MINVAYICGVPWLLRTYVVKYVRIYLYANIVHISHFTYMEISEFYIERVSVRSNMHLGTFYNNVLGFKTLIRVNEEINVSAK